MKITLKIARHIIDTAVKYAEKIGNCCSIAVVDDCGWLIALYKMDGTLIPTVDIARDKAWTAAVFKTASSDISKFGDASKPNFGLNATNWNDRLTTIAGGLPIKDGNEVLGAIGVSGGTPEEDTTVCQAAIVTLKLNGK